MTSHIENEQVEASTTNWLPAESCSVCRLSIEDVGGRRLLTTNTRSLLIRGSATDWRGRRREVRAAQLKGEFRQLFVVVTGFSEQDEILIRACAQAQAGQTPWFCQRCAGQVCERCGALTREVPGSTFLADDERTTYYALLPIGEPACSNQKCKGHR